MTEQKKELDKINKDINIANMAKEDTVVRLNNTKLKQKLLEKQNDLYAISNVKALKDFFRDAGVIGYSQLNKSALVKLFFKEGAEIIDYVHYVQERKKKIDDDKNDDDEKDDDEEEEEEITFNQPKRQKILQPTLAREASKEVEKRKRNKKK